MPDPDELELLKRSRPVAVLDAATLAAMRADLVERTAVAPTRRRGPGANVWGRRAPRRPGSAQERAVSSSSGPTVGRRVLVGLAAAMVVLLIGTLVVVRRSDQAGTDVAVSVVNEPLGAAPLPFSPAALAAPPAVPAGWRSVDYGLARLSVPEAWTTIEAATGSGQCATPGMSLMILGGGAVGGAGDCGPPKSFARVAPIGAPCESCGQPSVVHGLTVTMDVQPSCSTCPESWVMPELQSRLTIGGVDHAVRDQIVASLTLSTVARVLADGPTLDTSGWREVRMDGVSLRVPSDWPDHAIGWSCGGNPFPPGSALVLTGMPQPAGCAARIEPPPALVADGVWLVANGSYRDVDIVDLTIDGRGVAIDARMTDHLSLSPDGTTVGIRVGIGADPAVARTIVRTVRIAR